MKLDDINLTNDAKYLIAKIYQSYVEKRKSGALKRDAKSIGDIPNVHDKIMPEWLPEDVLETCFELKSHGLITGIPGGDTLFYMQLTDDGIAVMEVSFKDKVDNVLEYANKIKSLIPFI